MFGPNVWLALKQTAAIVLIAIGFGIGFAMVTCCGDDSLPPCPDKPCNCTRDGRCSCDGVPCVRAPMSIEHPDAAGSSPRSVTEPEGQENP